jgi:hypothetical protein
MVLDLTLLPSRGGRAQWRFDQMVRAHLQKVEIISARLADEDRLDCRLHVVVDAAPADPVIVPERLVVAVKHQLLGLAKVDARLVFLKQIGRSASSSNAPISNFLIKIRIRKRETSWRLARAWSVSPAINS